MPSQTSILITKHQHDACVKAIREGLKKTLEARMPLTASQWADKHFYLSPESSGTEGKWETLPYQIGILDVIGADEPRIVDLKKSARIGYTKMLDAAAAYFLEHKRRNTVLYQPTDGDAKDFCKTEIDPMVRDVPVLAKLADDEENKKRSDTLTMKKLGKKVLYILGGKAPSRFRRVTADVVFYDELDGFDLEIADEGDPLKLGDRCITNSSFPKSIRGSTPATKVGSLINKEFSNARYKFHYHVVCPECETPQPLEWKNFLFDGDEKHTNLEDRAATVKCHCMGCGVGWDYSEIWTLLEPGYWMTIEEEEDEDGNITRLPGYRIKTGDGEPILLDPDGMVVDWPRHVAFHIWAAYSPFMSWKELTLEWLEAQGDVLKLKTFTNHRFGEVWEDEGESIDENVVFENRRVFAVPEEVLAIISTVDIQDNRVEVETAGFGYGESAWHLEHKVIYGNTEHLWSEESGKLAPVWQELNDYLTTQKFLRDDGVIMAIDAVGVDTGFRSETAYRFCVRCAHPRTFALKGISGDSRPVVSAPSRQKTIDNDPIDLFGVGVDSAKALVIQRLGNMVKKKAPAINLNMDVTFELCEQITAEHRMTRFRRGFEVREWVKTRPRNEFFDLWVYQLAVLYIVNPSWRALEERRKKQGKKQDHKPKPTQSGGDNWVMSWRG